MNHLKNFLQFINEGAWYEGEGNDIKVYLSRYNNPSNETELLKTADPNGLNFSKRGIADIKTYFGLYPRKKYKSGEDESDLAKNLIMNNLKNNRFEMAPGETLGEFFQFTVLNNIKEDIDYIVSIGTSAGLVERMQKELLNLYPNALNIDLSKIKYTDWRDAIDWQSYIKKIESEFSIPRFFEKDIYYKVKEGDTLKKIAQRRGLFIDSILSFNPGLERNNLIPGERILIKKKGEPAPPNSDTFKYTERWIRRIEQQIRRNIEQGKDPSFEIRTSGAQGSIRGVLSPKYNTANEAFIDAVTHCVFGDGNGNFGKMIIIDDNINQGIDLRDVSNKITQILSGVIDITKNITEETLSKPETFAKIRDEYKRRIQQNSAIAKTKKELDNLLKIRVEENIKKNIFSYALYNFGESGKRYLPNEKFNLELLKKYFYVALADVKGIPLEKAQDMVKKDYKGFTLPEKEINYVPLTPEQFQEVYDKLLDKAADEYETISHEKKPDIIPILKPLLDNNIRKIIIADIKEEEEEEEIRSRYPNLDYIKIGDELINKNSGDTAVIHNINYEFGTFEAMVTSGPQKGMVTKSISLQTLDPNWTRGRIYKLKNQ